MPSSIGQSNTCPITSLPVLIDVDPMRFAAPAQSAASAQGEGEERGCVYRGDGRDAYYDGPSLGKNM